MRALARLHSVSTTRLAGLTHSLASRASLVALAGLAALGCSVREGSFEPLGEDVSLSGTWTIEGLPADAAACERLGIETVEVVLFEEALDTDDDIIRADSLRFRCAQGSFDSRSTGFAGGPFLLSYGRYYFEWRALDAAGTQVGKSTREMLDASLGTAGIDGHVELRSVCFSGPENEAACEPAVVEFDPRGSDAELTFEWTVDMQTPTEANCSAINVDNVALWLFASDDTSGANGVQIAMAPCENGKYDSMMKVIKNGSYLAQYRGLATDGTVSQMSEIFAVTSDTDRTMVQLADFQATATGGTGLTIDLAWETEDGGTGTCTDAGVSGMTYVLTDAASGDPVAVLDPPDACQDTLMFPEITAGTYNLLVEGYLMDGMAFVKNWSTDSTCNGLTAPTTGTPRVCTLSVTAM